MPPRQTEGLGNGAAVVAEWARWTDKARGEGSLVECRGGGGLLIVEEGYCVSIDDRCPGTQLFLFEF